MIQVEQLSIRVGRFNLRDIRLEVPAGGYAILMGRTGSGKTTLLEAICGLKTVTAGRVSVLGTDVTHLPPRARGIGYVPQDRALFQTMTVRDHLAFAPEIRGWPKDQVAKRVGELAELLGLAPLLDRKPAGLSGGEAQRVALGRALAAEPKVLLLDEPLSALDDETRDEMITLLKAVRDRTGVTTLHVTHHLEETRKLASSLFMLSNGSIAERALG
jgi:molybdate/tungstate transport system ATP-binding protein